MQNQELLNYISFQLEKNVPWEEIKNILLGKGWPADVLEQAKAEVLKNKPAGAAAVANKPSDTKVVADKSSDAKVMANKPEDKTVAAKPIDNTQVAADKPAAQPVQQQKEVSVEKPVVEKPIVKQESIIENKILPEEKPAIQQPQQQKAEILETKPTADQPIIKKDEASVAKAVEDKPVVQKEQPINKPVSTETPITSQVIDKPVDTKVVADKPGDKPAFAKAMEGAKNIVGNIDLNKITSTVKEFEKKLDLVNTLKVEEKEIAPAATPINVAVKPKEVNTPSIPVKESVVSVPGPEIKSVDPVIPKKIDIPQQVMEKKETNQPTNVQSAQPIPKPTTKKQSKKPFIGLMVLIILLVVVGGGVYAYFTYFAAPKITATTISKIINLKSFEYSGDGVIEMDDNFLSDDGLSIIRTNIPEINSVNTVSLKFSGVADWHNADDVKASLVVEALGESKSGTTSSLNGETRLINNVFYTKINSFGISGIPEDRLNLLKQLLMGVWIEAPMTDLNGGPISDGISQVIANTISAYGNNLEEFSNAITITLLKDEKVNGVDCYQARVVFKEQETRDIIAGLATQQNLTKKQADTLSDYLINTDTKIWIGKKDQLIRKQYIKFGFRRVNGSLGVFTINIYFKNHNNSFIVDVLANPIKKFSDLFLNNGPITTNPAENSETEQPSVENTITDPKDSEIATTMAQLKVAAETFKAAKGTYVGFISATDGGHDLVVSLNNLGGVAATTYTSKTKYCISKKLLVLNKYVCIDSSPYSYISDNQTCDKQTFSCDE
ncbi:MAG: hypothetical protein WC520_03330 [Candidatus Paceibacterota bacterium]